MSQEKDLELQGVLVTETPNAILVKKLPTSADEYWVPRSQIGYMRKSVVDGWKMKRIVFTAPEWLVEKSQMWELVP